MAKAKDGKAKKSRGKTWGSAESLRVNDKAKEETQDPVKKDKPKMEKELLIKPIFYNAGLISKDAVEILKKSTQTATYKKAGKAIGSFQNNVEAGWKYPEEVFAKDKIKIKGKPFGLIAGSFAKCGSGELDKAYKGTTRFLSKAYKKARIVTLIKMWKAEHPGATTTEKEKAVKEIEELFK